MIARHLSAALRAAARKYPVVTLTGPRQSGKTTLARAVFPRHEYVSLESPEHRAFAVEDPRGFLARFKSKVILDEIQRVPDLFS
jgi:predicted AAA+ superfamily ATPase